MENERELLALAAKAAGKKRHEWDFWWLAEQRQNVARDMLWDPRRDSGQALDLAAYLEFDVMHRVVSGRRIEVLPAGGPLTKHFYEGDTAAAMRQAIFNAAVEFGRAMP
jgi:hypothetical protein